MKRWQILLFPLVLVLANIACGTPAEEWELRGWTVTPSPFANTSTAVVPTWTPSIIIVSATPEPTKSVGKLCVSANTTVHLRPSPNTSGYPIEVLANGQEVVDLGGRVGKWWFVSVGKNQGWVDSNYLGEC